VACRFGESSQHVTCPQTHPASAFRVAPGSGCWSFPPVPRRGGRAKPAPYCSRTAAAAISTSATSTAATGSPSRRQSGIESLRDLYDLRHTYATFALRAGVPVFALSRFMGTSIAMIDLHYGHLAVDGYQHAVSLLDALALERAVDAGWTPAPSPANPHSGTVPRRHRRRPQAGGGRSVDVEAPTVATRANRRG
jgi:hypothetical protein